MFSDSELIKARGDRKAMLSLHFGEGGINKGLTAATQLSKPREEYSRLLLREVAWCFPVRGCVFHQLFFYWPGLPSLNLCSKDDTSVKIYHRSSCGEICKRKTNGLFAPWPQSPDPTDSPRFTAANENRCFKQPTREEDWADGIFLFIRHA